MATIINRPKRKRDTTGDYVAEQRRKVYATQAWRKLRLRKLQTTPLCEVCEAEGRLTAASEVHHKQTFVGVRDENECARLAFDFYNLQSLCKECHSRIHSPYRR